MSFQAKLPVISFFSLTSIVEKAIITCHTAKSFSRAGYRTLLIDLDFDIPIIFETLKYSSKWDNTSNNITTNEWILNPDQDINETIPNLVKVEISEDAPPMTISPCGNSIQQIRKWQALGNKEITKLFRRLTKIFRIIKKEKQFDIVVLNLPNNIIRASFPIMNSSFCYAITDHDFVSNSLLAANIEAVVGTHPLLKFSGVIIDKFLFEYPEKDQEEIEKVEDIISLPVLTTLPSIRSEKYISPGTLINWVSKEKTSTQDIFDKLSQSIEQFAEKPRTIKKKEKTRLYSVFIVSKAGLPLFTHYFLPQSETNEILASAGLSSLITSVTAMIGEIINRQDEALMIELKKVKMIIEEWRNYKFILLTSSYEDYLRENLKKFGRSFMNKYTAEIKKFEDISMLPTFEGIEEVLTKYFTENRPESIIL